MGGAGSIAGRPPRLLVVDDSADIRALVAAMFGPSGWDVSAAGTPREAALAVADHDPDVVMLDLGLEEGDGTAVIQALKADEVTAWIPVVVVSGSTDAEEVTRLLDLGAHEYIRKPWNGAELEDCLTRALQHAATQRPRSR